MNEDRLEKLLDSYFDENLSAAEREELEALLLSWPQARELFWKRARFNALLRRQGRESWGRRLAEQEVVEKAPSWIEPLSGWARLIFARPAWVGAAVAAVLATMLLVLRPWGDRKTQPALADLPATWDTATSASHTNPQGIATLVSAVDVKWTKASMNAGNVLQPGWLRFDAGLVELQFHRGARVVIEGPAEFELISDMQARCLAGKVRAEVPPPAVGFEILTPNVNVVDRGTAFGMEVKRDGPSDVHVFSGKVDLSLQNQTTNPRELKQGEAVRVDTGGNVSDIPNGAKGFVTSATVEKRANTIMVARFKAWQELSRSLQKDPSLLIQYTFDGDPNGDRVLDNKAPNAPLNSHGTIVGCKWTEGRWPAKPALDFKQVGDRIRLAVPRSFDAMTCVAWLRLDALEHNYIALLMSGDATVDELQWQLRGSGKLNFGKRREPGWGAGKVETVETAPLLGVDRCGSWVQIALVYDSATNTVAQYVDGRRTAMKPIWSQVPLRTAGLEIGNWTPISGQPMEPIRNFNGRMDEFLLFSRALSPEEIQHLWEVGRPL